MLPPKELAAKLAEFVGDPLLLIADDRASLGKEDKETAAPAEDESPSADDELAFGKELRFDDEAMRRVFEALNSAGGVDFTHYKRPTIRRRLHRRMLLSRIQRIEDDIQMLEQTPSEVQKLFRDVLIHVTRFFRDPESFDLLKAELPQGVGPFGGTRLHPRVDRGVFHGGRRTLLPGDLPRGRRPRGRLRPDRSGDADVRDERGRSYCLRVRPYTDTEKRIDGAVLSLFDIDELRRRESDLAYARDLGKLVIDTIRQPLVVMNDDLEVQRVNFAFHAMFRTGPTQLRGKPFAEVGGGVWDIPLLQDKLETVRGNDSRIEEFSLDDEFPGTVSITSAPGHGTAVAVAVPAG